MKRQIAIIISMVLILTIFMPLAAVPTVSGDTSIGTGRITASTLNVRKGASTSYAKIGVVRKGNVVTLLESKNGWYKISYGSLTGYVYGKYVTRLTTITPASQIIAYGKVSGTSILNVRTGKSTSYSKIGTLKRGARVLIIRVMSNGWYNILYKSGTAYVSNKYITLETQAATAAPTETPTSDATASPAVVNVRYGTIKVSTTLNVRSGPSTSRSRIGKLSNGARVQVISVLSGGWIKIAYKSGNGYVSGKYVKLDSVTVVTPTPTVVPTPIPATETPPTEAPTIEPAATSTPITPKWYGTVKVSTTLNVRSGPSTSNSRIGRLSNGTRVEVISTLSGGWIKIAYKSGVGYISGKYITLDTKPTPIPTTTPTPTPTSIPTETPSEIPTETPSETPTTEPTPSIYAKGVVTATSLNVRRGPSTSHSRYNPIKKGAVVEIIERTSNGWYKIIYKCDLGYAYVSAKYIKVTEGTVPAAPTPKPGEAPIWKPAKGKINLTWEYNPYSFKVTQTSIDVVSPMWLWIDKDKNSGKTYLRKGNINLDYVNAAHSKGIKVWACIASFSSTRSKEVMHNAELQKSIIDQLEELVVAYKLDGINLDFEYMDPADRFLYSEFAAKVTERLHKHGAVVSADIVYLTSEPFGTNWYSHGYDRKTLSKAVDYIMLMAYDQHTSGSGAGPVAGLPWVEKIVNITLEEVPAEKLIMGVPLYARDYIFEKVDGGYSSNAIDYVSAIGMSTIDKLERGQQVTYSRWSEGSFKLSYWTQIPGWDSSTGMIYMEFVDNKSFKHKIWYDDYYTMGKRLDIVNDKGIAGAATWHYALAEDGIWDVFKDKLNK